MQVAGHLFEGGGSGSCLLSICCVTCCQLSLALLMCAEPVRSLLTHALSWRAEGKAGSLVDDSGHFYKPLQVQPHTPSLATVVRGACTMCLTSSALRGPCTSFLTAWNMRNRIAVACHSVAFHKVLVVQTGPRGQRELKFYETVHHEKQGAAASPSTVGESSHYRRCKKPDVRNRPTQERIIVVQTWVAKAFLNGMSLVIFIIACNSAVYQSFLGCHIECINSKGYLASCHALSRHVEACLV